MQTRTLMCTLMILVAGLVDLGFGLSRAAAQSVVLELNQTHFQPGETLVLTVTVTPAPTPVPVDAYVAVQLPDNSLFFLQLTPTFTSAFEPIARSFTPTTPVTVELLRYKFQGNEPVGTYRCLAAFSPVGSRPTQAGAVVPFTFTTVNIPPVADAGPDRFPEPGETVMLDGSGSTDADDDADALRYHWTFQARPENSKATLLPNAMAVRPTLTPDLPGQYTLLLTVSDPHGGTASD